MSSFNDAMESGFSVCEEVVIGDLTQVKEEKQLVPAAKRVKLRVKKAESQASKDNAYRWINLQLQIVDGIDDAGAYKGKVVFGKVCYYADMAKYGEKEFFKKKQHLIGLKQFITAIGADLSKITIGDSFLTGVVNQMVLADITQTKGNTEFGPDNEVKNYREVSAESMV
jgi:hypothetical protein